MNKNIFDLYKDENGTEEVTVESTVSPLDLIIGEAEYEDAKLTVEQALAHADTIETTVGAIAQFEKEFAPVEAAIAGGEVTTESAVTAQTAYETLCGNLNISANQLEEIGCAVLSTEDSTQYPEATAKLTREGAMKLVEAIKAKVAEIVKNIINSIKKMGVQIAAYAANIENASIGLAKEANTNYTDELIDGAEVNIEAISSRMAVFGSLNKDNVLALIAHANDPKVAGTIKEAFSKDVTAKKFENIFTLVTPTLKDVVSKDLFKDDKKGEVTNVYPLGVDGDSVSALVTRKTEDGSKVAKETGKVTDIKGFKGNTPLKRTDIVEIVAELVKASKKQKDLVKAIAGMVENPKVEGDDEAFLKQVPQVLNAVTSAYIALAMSTTTTNKSALYIASNSLKLYKPKGKKAPEKKEEK